MNKLKKKLNKKKFIYNICCVLGNIIKITFEINEYYEVLNIKQI